MSERADNALLRALLVLVICGAVCVTVKAVSPGTLVHGVVLNRKTWEPVPEALVEIGEQISISDENGRYSITAVPEGWVSAHIQAEDYGIWQDNIYVSGDIQKLDISLEPMLTERIAGDYTKSRNFLTLSGPSGGLEVSDPFVLDADTVVAALHFLRARQKLPEKGIVPERVDHFDVISSRIGWGFATDWEVGAQFMHKSLIGYPRFDTGSLVAFHMKYHISDFAWLAPMSIGMQGGLEGDSLYFLAIQPPLPDALKVNLLLNNNAVTGSYALDWGFAVPLQIPEQMQYMTDDSLELIVERVRNSVINYGLRFYRECRSVDLLYRQDFSNDITSYGVGGNILF